MTRLGEAFARARRERRAVLVAYVTAGDPSTEATVALARGLERAGAEVLELGVPFSDPIADGPVLQRAAVRALASGTTLESVFAVARRIREETSLALVLFSYVNPVHRFGFRRTAEQAAASGFDGVLLTDLPPEEARGAGGGGGSAGKAGIVPEFRRAGLDTIFLASPTSTPGRLRAAASLSRGFLYVVSRAGTTGARRAFPPELPATVRRARRAAGTLPIALGFGIADPESARRAARLADGVVVGSALVAAAERAGPGSEAAVSAVEALARDLVAACRRRRPSA